MSTKHILKTRDDKGPVEFVDSGDDGNFVLAEGADCSWIVGGTEFGPDDLRPRVEPWLTALFQSEHLALLAGSGLSHAVHHLATGEILPGMSEVTFTNYNAAISDKAKESAKLAGREEGNIEDQIRVVNELICGIEILSSQEPTLKEQLESLRSELKTVLGNFAESVLKAENGLVTAPPEELKEAFLAFPNWRTSEAALRELRQKVTFALVAETDDIDSVVGIVDRLFSLLERASRV